MAIDKTGFDLINQGYEQDKAAHAEKRAQEIDAKYAKEKYVGSPQDDEDRRRREEEKQAELAALNNGDEQTLDQLHFGEYGGRENVLKILAIQERIEQVKQKWRDRDTSKAQEKEIRKEEGLSKDFNDQSL